MPGELHREIAGQAVRALNKDATHPGACDPLKHRLEAGALVDGIRAGQHRVMVPVRDGDPGRLGAQEQEIVLGGRVVVASTFREKPP